MTALVDEETVMAQEIVDVDLDQVLWQAWKAMKLPEGYRAEIIEGSIDVSPTGRRRHAVLAKHSRYAGELSLPYGTDLTIPTGPAKGLVIGESVTGGR